MIEVYEAADPAEPATMTTVLPYALAVLGLGLLGGIGVRMARRRS